MTILETERTILRYMTPDDYDDLAEIHFDVEAMAKGRGAFTPEELRGWMQRTFERYERLGFGLFVVERKSDGEVLGEVGLSQHVIEGESVLELGYFFKRKHWRQGYASECAKACVDYAHLTLESPVVCSLIHGENDTSRRVAERIGMTLEKQVAWNDHGQHVLIDFYSIRWPHAALTAEHSA